MHRASCRQLRAIPAQGPLSTISPRWKSASRSRYHVCPCRTRRAPSRRREPRARSRTAPKKPSRSWRTTASSIRRTMSQVGVAAARASHPKSARLTPRSPSAARRVPRSARPGRGGSRKPSSRHLSRGRVASARLWRSGSASRPVAAGESPIRARGRQEQRRPVRSTCRTLDAPPRPLAPPGGAGRASRGRERSRNRGVGSGSGRRRQGFVHPPQQLLDPQPGPRRDPQPVAARQPRSPQLRRD